MLIFNNTTFSSTIDIVTMATELLQIQPPQLTFVFELKKQSSCLVHLANKASHHVAFKVKTTSPNKYCVRPTIGIIEPHGTCDFTVTMQPQPTVPTDFHCKDKFLVQSTLVPSGTTQDHITSHLFVKDSGRHVEEKKLRVVFLSPTSSPVNGQDFKHHPPNQIHLEEDVEKVGIMKPPNDVANLSLRNDSEELKSRLSVMDSKLREAEGTIIKLNEERRRNIREKDLLKQELEVLKKKIYRKRAQEGFPLLFVCVVALVSVAAGYYIHP